jgi:GTP pyrophosphokinase
VTTAVSHSAAELPPWLARYTEGEATAPFIDLAREFVATLEKDDGAKHRNKLIAAADTLQVLSEIEVDIDSVSAAMVSVLPGWDTQRVGAELGANIASLADGLKRLRAIESLGAESASMGAQQLESLRKMLLAMAQDMRVVLIKLAEQVGVMRSLTNAASHLQRQAATHTLNLYTPLANRLGVWQLKWELEDLAFRFLEPQTYQDIARLVDERRVDRENYIEQVLTLLKEALHTERLNVEVQGRPKHIYSIYKKMQQKQLAFDELYDVRALRVLTPSVKDCYTALGVVHNLWQAIPGEFDDYIAQPKGNSYRSLHTAVTGPEGRALEVQIRTHDMHRESEFGIAAHWRYKDGGRSDRKYDAKIAWLRQVLDWRDELSTKQGGALFQDSVYVLTPQGQVIDLPRGATPVDFAYHVHTDLGHRCRGAKVDGAMVPLNYVLKNAQYVEIVAAKQGGPSRDWLNTNLGYLASHRGLAKVRQWFNHQELSLAIASGRTVLEKEMQRAGRTGIALERIASTLNFPGVNEMFAAISHGELTGRQLQQAILADGTPAASVEEGSLTHSAKALTSSGGILVLGVNNIATMMAKCCKPAPPEAIIGFVSKTRGVVVHRADCRNFLDLDPTQRERMIQADWGSDTTGPYAVDIAVEAIDRAGLLRDISDAMTRERVNVTAANTLTRGAHATLFFTLEIPDLGKLQLVLQSIRNVDGVTRAGRKR